ncbi:MAG: transcriptional repressor [Deltaproteobacteria bacterium]|nr:transcriptional repressor [Deltaproteobacteria bacterium]
MLNSEQIQERVDAFVVACRQNGYSVTPQRLALYRELVSTDQHPSPEILFEKVRAQMPTLSLATVYKAVDTFRALGVIADVSPLHDRMRLDGNTEPHHHLICVDCKRVVDLSSGLLDQLKVPAEQASGFEVFTHSVQFTGRCPDCGSAG